FGGIALAGLVMLVCYAVWLAHKAADVWSEVDMLAVRANELARLVAQIEVPERAFESYWPADRTINRTIDGEIDRGIRDVG
ncbi:MAG: hypothetical protein ACRDPL_12530, partial [Propionibacteriaceae bacterium]